MKTSLLLLSLFLSLGVIFPLAAQEIKPTSTTQRAEVPKVEKEGVWQPTIDGVQFPLWPENFPLSKPDSGDHPEVTGNGSPTIAGKLWNWASYVTRPTMTIYRPKTSNNGAAILVLPGGGFRAVAMDLEGTEICDWVVQKGMTCVLLKYRTPQVWHWNKGQNQRPKTLLPLEDAQRAMGLLRLKASEYGINPNKIGAIGFSAGAYLAAELSNNETRTYAPSDAADRLSTIPNFAIIAYTARIWDQTSDKTNLKLAQWVKISTKAPPTLIIHAMDDDVDNIRHPLAYALALNEVGVRVDLRVYATGGHAFGMRRTDDLITKEWPEQMDEWLRNLGVY